GSEPPQEGGGAGGPGGTPPPSRGTPPQIPGPSTADPGRRPTEDRTTTDPRGRAGARTETPVPPPMAGLCRECGGHHATKDCPTLLPPAEQDHPRRRTPGPAPGRAQPPPWSGGPLVDRSAD